MGKHHQNMKKYVETLESLLEVKDKVLVASLELLRENRVEDAIRVLEDAVPQDRAAQAELLSLASEGETRSVQEEMDSTT